MLTNGTGVFTGLAAGSCDVLVVASMVTVHLAFECRSFQVAVCGIASLLRSLCLNSLLFLLLLLLLRLLAFVMKLSCPHLIVPSFVPANSKSMS
jgi:hypothetical protein